MTGTPDTSRTVNCHAQTERPTTSPTDRIAPIQLMTTLSPDAAPFAGQGRDGDAS